MKTARALLALGLASCAAAALAHPGHEAPPVHAHDLEEVALMIAVVVLAALAAAGAYALRRRASKPPPP